MTEEEKKAIGYFKRRILNSEVRFLPYIDSEKAKILLNYIDKLQKEIEDIKEYVNSSEFLDWNLGFKLIDELEYRKDRINKLLGEEE